MNGTGYPFGLSKKRIPLESKLYSIIRAYEVLGSMSKSKQVEATMKAWASEGG
jgi:HD-GYP domain-containing protein (c-di-GMP phosphodiesterase class II)